MERTNYGQKIKYGKIDSIPTLKPDLIKFFQKVTKTFTFYDLVVHSMMIHALNDIASSADVESTYNITIFSCSATASHDLFIEAAH